MILFIGYLIKQRIKSTQTIKNLLINVSKLLTLTVTNQSEQV